jgi:putative holliday junction resolvase
LICIGVDPGLSRVGLAIGQGELALGIEVCSAQSSLDRIREIVVERKAERIYVGLPLSLSGQESQSTKLAVKFASSVAKHTHVDVYLIDERLTSSQSLSLSRTAGKSSKESKSFVDAEAARLIVESAIASKHTLGVRLEDYLADN